MRGGRYRLLVAFGLVLWTSQAEAAVQRHAIFVANNIGHGDDSPLLYAHSDARKLRSAFVGLGGFEDSHTQLLLEATPNQLNAAFDTLARRLRAAQSSGDESMLVVYYSGHADEQNLHLGAHNYALASLLAKVKRSGATVSVVVLDACQSGAIIRSKGTRAAKPFDIKIDRSLGVRGVAVLASSTGREEAQESDRFGGSYFSHYLVSGLLGAADRNNDDQVTLDEARLYAYDHTVRATSDEGAKIQHPSYAYQVEGSQAIVLTRPRAPELRHATLELPENVGFLVLKGSAEGPVEAEIGAFDRQRKLALRPGRYHVRTTDELHLRETSVRLSARQKIKLNLAELQGVAYKRDADIQISCPRGFRRSGHRCVNEHPPPSYWPAPQSEPVGTDSCDTPVFTQEDLVRARKLSAAHGCDDGRGCTIDTWNRKTGACEYHPYACACSEWSCADPKRLEFTVPEHLVARRAIWLRADQGVHGNPVARWNSPGPSRYAAAQSIVEQRPQHLTSGGPCGDGELGFDGVDDNLNFGSNYLFVDSSHSGMTVFAVVRSDGVRTAPVLIELGYAGEWAYTMHYDAELLSMSVADGSGIHAPHAGAQHGVGPETWTLVSYRVAFGDKLELRVRGQVHAETPIPNVHRLDQEVIRAHPTPIREYGGPLTLGGSSKHIRSDRNLYGGLAEVQIFDEALSDGELKSVECVLARRYALPIAHKCGD